jgi:regulator of replication initiation timing
MTDIVERLRDEFTLLIDAATEIERLRPIERQAMEELNRVNTENERLRALLKECADRFERCCRSAGNDAVTAAMPVSKYRAALSTNNGGET